MKKDDPRTIKDIITFFRPDFFNTDERGWFCQICRQGWNQVNVSFSYAGTKRGGHYHKINREAFYIIMGNIKLELKKNKEVHTISVNSGDLFALEKNVLHTFEYINDTLTVSIYDLGVELNDGKMDIHGA